MSERYTRIYVLPTQPKDESIKVPVEVTTGALLFDKETNSVLAQIKYKNISDKSIATLCVNIHAQDATGAAITGIKRFTYDGVISAPNSFFGDKTPVVMADGNTHTFTVEIVAVTFSDGTFWSVQQEQSAIAAKEIATATKEAAKVTVNAGKAAGKAAVKFAVKLPALIANIFFTIIMGGATFSAIQDYIADPSAKKIVTSVFLVLSTIVSVPGFGRLIFRKKYGILQRFLRWVIFLGVIALDFIVMAIFFK